MTNVLLYTSDTFDESEVQSAKFVPRLFRTSMIPRHKHRCSSTHWKAHLLYPRVEVLSVAILRPTHLGTECSHEASQLVGPREIEVIRGRAALDL